MQNLLETLQSSTDALVTHFLSDLLEQIMCRPVRRMNLLSRRGLFIHYSVETVELSLVRTQSEKAVAKAGFPRKRRTNSRVKDPRTHCTALLLLVGIKLMHKIYSPNVLDAPATGRSNVFVVAL